MCISYVQIYMYRIRRHCAHTNMLVHQQVFLNTYVLVCGNYAHASICMCMYIYVFVLAYYINSGNDLREKSNRVKCIKVVRMYLNVLTYVCENLRIVFVKILQISSKALKSMEDIAHTVITKDSEDR